MECYVGKYISEDCHKSVYGDVPKEIKVISEFSDNEKLMLQFRISDSIENICKYHEIKFLDKYYHLYGRICCDPLKYHKKPVKKSLREITLTHLSRRKSTEVNLIPGKALCSTCNKKLFKLITDNEDEDPLDDPNYAIPETIHVVDQTCSVLGISPASKIRKLSSDKRASAIECKVSKISETLKRKLYANLDEDHESLANPLPMQNENPFDYEQLITKLKEKCEISNKEEKIKIISLLPSSWSRNKISIEFNVSERLVKLARDLAKKQGIMPDLTKRNSGKVLSLDTIKIVTEFYLCEENSRICPGKKDYVAVRIDGKSEHKQKQLLLCNLNELFVKFKETYPDIKIGRSKFCELRPKWCIIAGASGTHSVCVCSYHQNVKLMIDGAKLNVEYKDLLEALACDVNKYECMMSECKECGDEKALLNTFLEADEINEMPDDILYKQWVTVDRAEMITVSKPRDEFLESLVGKVNELKAHHYVSKIQSASFKNIKSTLTKEVCVVVADFSENFSFVVQDEIQSYHWVNKQATIHPFVYYYFDEDSGLVKNRSLCVISNHQQHNTAVVHTFQKYLIEDIKNNVPAIKKIIYFTDGSSSQYKNQKNFLNLCLHENDFGLAAEWHFFATAHGKNACDGVGGTTKREVTKKSLQSTTNNQILNAKDMFHFCSENLSGIQYFYVDSEEITKNETELQVRFKECLKIPGTRSFHRFVPVADNKVQCYKTSKCLKFAEMITSKNISFTLEEEDIIACTYDKQWWIGKIKSVNLEHNDCFVHFFEPSGPRTSFKLSKRDEAWVPLSNVLRKLTPLELTTATGRNYNITQALCDEISQLLNGNQS